jgi:hypothetical protein
MKYNIYKCKSSYQKDFLKKNGLDYIWVDVDKSNTTFWLYDRTEKFEKIIKEYSNI